MTVRHFTKYHCLFHFMVRFRTDLAQPLERFQTNSLYYSSISWYDVVPIIAVTDFFFLSSHFHVLDIRRVSI